MNALIIARRDLASYLQGYLAYVILAALLLFNGAFFVAYALGESRLSHEVLERFFYVTWGFAVATAVFVTMRSLADEHTQGTEVLLRTSVVQDFEIVLGKWLAAMGMVSLYVALTLHMPAMVFMYGKISFAHLVVGYTGVLLGSGVACALGVFFSALFRNQLAAGVVGGLFAIYMAILSWIIAELAEPPYSDVIAYTAIFNEHFVPFMEGSLSLSATFYQVSLGAMFLGLSTLILNGRRWE